jgi:hypothetical protein
MAHHAPCPEHATFTTMRTPALSYRHSDITRFLLSRLEVIEDIFLDGVPEIIQRCLYAIIELLYAYVRELCSN